MSDGQAGHEANGGGDGVREHVGDLVGKVVRVCRGDMYESVCRRRKRKWVVAMRECGRGKWRVFVMRKHGRVLGSRDCLAATRLSKRTTRMTNGHVKAGRVAVSRRISLASLCFFADA